MSSDDYKKKLGTPNSYLCTDNLKDNTIDAPINEKRDLGLTYKAVKRGKRIVGLNFKVKGRPEPKDQVLIQLFVD